MARSPVSVVQERVLVLETEFKTHREQFDEHRAEVKDFNKAMIEKLDAMNVQLSRNKGFWGGVVLVITAIWAVISVYGHTVARMFKTGG